MSIRDMEIIQIFTIVVIELIKTILATCTACLIKNNVRHISSNSPSFLKEKYISIYFIIIMSLRIIDTVRCLNHTLSLYIQLLVWEEFVRGYSSKTFNWKNHYPIYFEVT